MSPAGGRVSPAGGRVSPAGGRVSPAGGRVSPAGGRGSPINDDLSSLESPCRTSDKMTALEEVDVKRNMKWDRERCSTPTSARYGPLGEEVSVTVTGSPKLLSPNPLEREKKKMGPIVGQP